MLSTKIRFSISIVSHGHRDHVVSLLNDLAGINRSDIEVILTWNLKAEEADFSNQAFPFEIISVTNYNAKGFAQNHNAAFTLSHGQNFVILNPDIRMPADPFDELLAVLRKNSNCICAPLIVNPENKLEDSARFFPTPFSLAKKALGKFSQYTPPSEKIPDFGDVLNPDWIAGMFMVVPRQIYEKLGGLQERYHLYYEDVDFCARARIIGIDVLVAKNAAAIHDAQRDSHKNFRFFFWHLKSVIKFFSSKSYLILMLRKKIGVRGD